MLKDSRLSALYRRQSVFVPREPGEVFALVDDVSSMHRWLDRCIRVQKYHGGENAVGDALRCVYQGLTRHGVLTGAIVAREPARNLACVYAGRFMRVAFDFSLSPRGEGTYLTHFRAGHADRLAGPAVVAFHPSHARTPHGRDDGWPAALPAGRARRRDGTIPSVGLF